MHPTKNVVARLALILRNEARVNERSGCVVTKKQNLTPRSAGVMKKDVACQTHSAD
jgi:hypothetical protein